MYVTIRKQKLLSNISQKSENTLKPHVSILSYVSPVLAIKPSLIYGALPKFDYSAIYTQFVKHRTFSSGLLVSQRGENRGQTSGVKLC